jgi:hypothetical protein
LAVIGFKDMDTADKVVPELEALQREGLIQLADWARVIRKADGSIDTKQMTNTTGAGAAGGALWGMLFGLIFFIPLAGLLIGGAMGALMGHLSTMDRDKFIKEVGKQITPGSWRCSCTWSPRPTTRFWTTWRPSIQRDPTSLTGKRGQTAASHGGDGADTPPRRRRHAGQADSRSLCQPSRRANAAGRRRISGARVERAPAATNDA